MASAVMALTMGAPAKTMVITVTGLPLAPKASSTHSAPMAPRMPAISDHHRPLAGKLQSAPPNHSSASGASTAVRK